MASTWQLLAKNHIGNRAWSDISRAWSAAALGFDPLQAQDLSAAVEPILNPDFSSRANVSVFNFPGRRVAAFMDAGSAAIKAAYILRSTGNCLLGGQPTWAAIDAYHFSFVAARALLGLLGVHLVRVCDSYAVLDVFPEGETERERRQFQRDYRHLNEPCRLIFRSHSSVIDQRAIWTILLRVLRVSTFDYDLQAAVGKITELGGGFASTRNDILYQNRAWLYDEDYLEPAVLNHVNDDPFSSASPDEFFDEKDSNFAFAMLMLQVLKYLVNSVEVSSGTNVMPTSYGVCFKGFSGFDPRKLHSVFSPMYRRESYGAAL